MKWRLTAKDLKESFDKDHATVKQEGDLFVRKGHQSLNEVPDLEKKTIPIKIL